MGKIPDDLRQIIADNIRKCRMKKFPGRGGGKKCAEAFEVSPQQWSPWECGKRTPGEDKMKQIAEFFNVSVAFLRQDRRHLPDEAFSIPPSPGSPASMQSHMSPPNSGRFTTPYGTPPPFGELPQVGAAPQPGAPPPTGTAPQSGNDTYWLMMKFFPTVSNNGIFIRLAVQDMDYLGDCIAQALVRRGVVFPPHR